MKHPFNLTLLLLAALLLPATALAYDFEVDGIYYNIINDNQAEVAHQYNGLYGEGGYEPTYSGNVSIPATVTYNGTTYSVTAIGEGAFYNCSGLTSIEIPNSIINIGWTAFAGCSNLTSVNIPNHISYIQSDMFDGCTSLTSITIPESVTHIGLWAFCGCTNLKTLNFNAIRCEFDWDGGAGDYQSSAFEGCPIETVNIGEAVTLIPEGFIINNTTLSKITIPESVTTIGEGAFYNCSRLASISIPDHVNTIGSEAFKGTAWYNNQSDGMVYAGKVAYKYKGTMPENTSIELLDGTLGIAGRAFYGYQGLSNIALPNSVNAIGNEAFLGTSWYNNQPDGLVYAGLVAYKYKGIMSENTHIELKNGTLGIAEEAFLGCEGLYSISIPNSVVEIGNSAFHECTSLNGISIPNSVMAIRQRTFQDCNELRNISLQPSIKYIDMMAFGTCWSLSSVYIPNSVIVIGQWAFCDCNHISSLSIPNSIVSIGGCAFSSNPLTDVYCYITEPNQIAWIDDPVVYGTLHVPAGTIQAYQTSNWSPYFSSIVEMDNVFIGKDTTAVHGDTVTIPIALNNKTNCLAFQTDIFLPEGFSLATNPIMEPVVTPSERLTSDHVMMTQNVSNGAVRVMCYTPNAMPIEGNEGDLFYITVQVPEDAAGDYAIYLRNSRLTTADYTELRVPDACGVLTVKTYIPGDANDSRSVNVADIVATAMYVMEMNPSPFIFDAADMNGDGEITVTDIMLIARMILYPEGMNAPRHTPAIGSNNDRMSGEAFTTGATRKVSIMLDNEMDYSAFQLDLTLPEGLTASNFELTDRAGDHVLDVNTLANGKTRVLCYTPAIQAIDGHEGAVLTFDITANGTASGDITVDGIELVTTACEMVRLGAFTIGVDNITAVNEVAAGKTVARVDYYNVAGQRLAQPEHGMTLQVTTYTDGTRTTTKLIQ